MSALRLTTIGSRDVTVEVGPAALPEAGPGGVAIELGLYERPLVLTLTRREAERLLDLIERQLWTSVDPMRSPE